MGYLHVFLCASVHSGHVPEEWAEQRRLLHDVEEPTCGSEPLQTGMHICTHLLPKDTQSAAAELRTTGIIYDKNMHKSLFELT